MKKVIIMMVVGMLVFSGCTNRKDANRALTGAGYSNIQIEGYNFLACSDDDFYHTSFRALNPNGSVVTGTVCSGLLFKNATIRF